MLHVTPPTVLSLDKSLPAPAIRTTVIHVGAGGPTVLNARAPSRTASGRARAKTPIGARERIQRTSTSVIAQTAFAVGQLTQTGPDLELVLEEEPRLLEVRADIRRPPREVALQHHVVGQDGGQAYLGAGGQGSALPRRGAPIRSCAPPGPLDATGKLSAAGGSRAQVQTITTPRRAHHHGGPRGAGG